MEKITEKLKVRCPSCAKLYEVEAADIMSAAPQFHCVGCETRFTFFFPPVDPQNIVCTTVNAQGQISPLDLMMKNNKSCSKCGALSPRVAEECYACHVIFSRLEGLPNDPALRAQPSLVRKWKLLLNDFESEEKHEDFISSCQKLEALGFALTKYQDIKQAQGGDALSERMIFKINNILDLGLRSSLVANSASSTSIVKNASNISSRPSWQKYVLWAPYILSMILIFWGFFSLGHRNLIGLGVATACLATGLIAMVKGQFRLQDFIK